MHARAKPPLGRRSQSRESLPKDEPSLKGRFFRETYSTGENVAKIEFENAQVRITRLILAKGLQAAFSTGSSEPALFVALTEAKLRVSRGAGPRVPFVLKTGRPLTAEPLKRSTKKHDHGSK